MEAGGTLIPTLLSPVLISMPMLASTILDVVTRLADTITQSRGTSAKSVRTSLWTRPWTDKPRLMRHKLNRVSIRESIIIWWRRSSIMARNTQGDTISNNSPTLILMRLQPSLFQLQLIREQPWMRMRLITMRSLHPRRRWKRPN